MNTDAIKLFCDVAQHRSVSRGAELNGVTQSAASQRIRALEKELGVTLIDRSTRPLKLTTAGERYHRGCRKIIERYEKLTAELTEANGLRGEVTIAAIYSAGIDLLNQVKSNFEQAHPRVNVSVSYLQPDDVYDRVRNEQCDLGILSYPERWRELASLPLRQEIMSVVMRPDHELAGGQGVHVSQLAPYDLVNFDLSLPIGRRIKKHLRDHGVEANFVGQFDNIDTIKNYVVQTGAVAILPKRTVQREIAAGTLASLPLEPRMVRPVGIVTMRHRQQSPLVKAFIDYLVKHRPTAQDTTIKVDPAAVSV